MRWIDRLLDRFLWHLLLYFLSFSFSFTFSIQIYSLSLSSFSFSLSLFPSLSATVCPWRWPNLNLQELRKHATSHSLTPPLPLSFSLSFYSLLSPRMLVLHYSTYQIYVFSWRHLAAAPLLTLSSSRNRCGRSILRIISVIVAILTNFQWRHGWKKLMQVA